MMILPLLIALAAGPDELIEAPLSATFQVADLDLATSVGKKLYDRRLAGAVEQVCGSYANAPELTDQDRITSCRKQATASAARQLAAKATSIRFASRAQH